MRAAAIAALLPLLTGCGLDALEGKPSAAQVAYEARATAVEPALHVAEVIAEPEPETVPEPVPEMEPEPETPLVIEPPPAPTCYPIFRVRRCP